MAKLIIIKQENLESINVMNHLKQNDSYIVLNEYNGYSTICQYSQKYDNFHIVDVKSENLNPNLRVLSGAEL